MDSTTLRIILEAQDKASGVFDSISGKLQQMGLVSNNEAKKISSLGDASTATSTKLKTIGGVASAVVAGGLIVAGAEAVRVAGNFQQMTSTLVTTAGESEKNIQMVRDGILKLSSDTGTGVAEMSKAMYTIESAGYHGAQGLTILKAAAQGAKTENADLQKVADAVTSAMRDYHEPANQAANVTSKLVAAVGAGKANFEDFSGALHSVLPIASAAHISLNDILGTMASMTVHGISAEQASQNLAEAIRTLQSPSQSASQYLYQIGINASDLTTKLSKEGLSGTLQDISNAIMQHMGPAGKVLIDSFNKSKAAAADAKQMFDNLPKSLQSLAKAYDSGTMSYKDYFKAEKDLDPQQRNLLNQYTQLKNNASGFNNLLKSGSPAALTYSQALQKATGNATTMNVALMTTGENAQYTTDAVKTVGKAHAEAGNNVAGWAFIQKNFNQQMSEAKNTLTNTGIAIGTALLPAVTSFLKVLLGILKPIAEWITQHKKLATIILASITGVAVLTATILLLGGAFNKIKLAAGMLQTVFGKMWSIITSDTVKAVAKQTASAVMTAARWVASAATTAAAWVAANAVMLLGIGLVIAAVVAAVILIVKNWSKIKDFFVKLWEDIKNFVAGHMKLILEIILGPIAILIANWGAVSRFFSGLLSDIMGAFSRAWDWIKRSVSGAAGWLVDAGRNIIDGLVHGVENAAGAAVNAVKKVGKDIVNAAKSVLKIFSPSEVFADIGGNISEGMAKGIGDKSTSVVSATTKLAQAPISTATQMVVRANTGNTAGTIKTTAPQTTTVMAPGNQTHYSINVNVGAYAGQPGEIDKLGEAIWQSFQRIARKHGMADQLPNIGVRPT